MTSAHRAPLVAIAVLAGPVLAGGGYSLAASLGLVGAGSSGFTVATWLELLRAGETWRSVGWTLLTAGAGTALAFAAAVTVARGAGGSLLARQLALIPLALPHVAGALAALLLLGQSGFLSRAAHAVGWIDGPAEFPAMVYDPAGIGLTLAFAWKEFPFLLLNAIAVLDSRDRTLEETARSLGPMRRRHGGASRGRCCGAGWRQPSSPSSPSSWGSMRWRCCWRRAIRCRCRC
ncbi:MAG: hypothetical protein IPJ56_03170 [Gemmatimonadetes bacterium]|nr:hypothetical protein [Gemmatimonadota bacterium]